MKRVLSLRNLILGAALAVLLISIVFTALAVNADSNAKANVTLAIAEAAIVLTVLATLYQLVLSPREQRKVRHTVRVEEGAAKIMPLLGLRAGMALGELHSAWRAGDSSVVCSAAGVLATLAEQAFHIAESIYDPLEVLIGVLMVEAMELRDSGPRLAAIPHAAWSSDPAAAHLRLIEEYEERISSHLNQILKPEV